MEISPIKAFNDNYLWLLESETAAAIVDPGDARPVMAVLKNKKLTLEAILITHHHADHTGGIRTLKKAYPDAKVYGPGCGRIPCIDFIVGENDSIFLGSLGSYTIMEVPGHTSSHIAYYGENSLFIGDTVFAAGCGRLFEGTPAQMVNSFAKIRKLPPETLIYCAHEYTLNNMRFAKEADPSNAELAERQKKCTELRKKDIPTVPFKLAEELQTNPFFRCASHELQQSASRYSGRPVESEIDTFAVIRQWKDTF